MARTHQQGTETSQRVRADESAARVSQDTHLADAAVDVKNPTETEAALAQTVRLLEHSLESQAGTILFSIDAEYRYLYFNKAHADVMKAAYAAEPKIGLNILERISSDEDRVVAKENYDRALAGESHSNVRVFGDVEKAYYESFFNPILDDAGTVIGATGMARDVTERKQAEETLREREYLLSASQRAAHVGTWSWEVGDPTVYWSDETYRIYGLNPEMGPPSFEFFFEIIQPEDRTKMQEWAEAVAAGLHPPAVEFRVVRTDGSMRVIRTEGDAIETIDGVPSRMAGTAYDVTERTQAEAQVEQMKRLYATLSQVNKTIVRVKGTSELWQSMCDAAVEFGQFTLAWVGLHDEESGEVRPVAANGIDVAQWPFAIVNTLRGDSKDGLAATAILSGNVVVTEDIQTDKRMRSVIGQFEGRNYHSIAAIPFGLRGETTGALVLVVSEAGSFKSAQEVRLLEEMGLNISFALDTMATEEERVRGQEQLAAQARRLEVLADASRAFAEVVAPAAILDRVTIRVSEVVGGSCWVRLLSDDQEWLDVAALRDTDPQTQEDAYAILSQQRQPVADSGIASKVFLSGDPALIPVVGPEQLRGMSPQRLWPLFERFAMHSIVVAALRVHGRSIGVMGVTRSRSDQPAFTMDDLSLVQDLADRAAMAIANAQLLEDQGHHLETIAGSLSSMIEVVTSVVEARDPYTAGHERRVSELAVRIADEMGLSAEQVEDIRTAALVHDVGKVSVPAEILSKPGRLTEIEFELIKGHSEAGFEILSSANMERGIAEMVYQHHERCDGSGYPRGLSEDELLSGAKVLAVADVVEAMISHRPYRAGLGVDAALAEIERGAGVQYDARASEACIRAFREGAFEFSEAGSV